MNLIEIEKREEMLRQKYSTFSNVGKSPYVGLLPFNLFVAFAVVMCIGVVAVIGALIVGQWIIALIIITIVLLSYKLLTSLVEKYGIHFWDRLIAYHTSESFTEVKANTKLQNP